MFMRQIITLCLVLFIVFGFKANDPKDYMSFDKITHNFGTIAKDIPVKTLFVLTNTGKSSLLINSVGTQCGCTTPQFNKAPIAPGKNDTIIVGYNAAAMGSFTKKITVRTNFGSTDLFIKGTVAN